MLQRLLAAILFIAIPGVTRAQEAPERVLPSGSQLYLRWDGFDGHREAFDTSALGKMMKGDTGVFLLAIGPFLEKQVDGFADQVDPKVLSLVREIPEIARMIGKNGFRIGAEFRGLSPIEAEAMFVFPGLGKAEAPLLPLIKKIAALANLKVKTKKVENNRGERWTSHYTDGKQFQLGWWGDGVDAVVLIGLKKRVDSARVHRFTSHRLYNELKSFREFPTWVDGYLDIAAIAKLADASGPDVKRLIDDLGLSGLNSITCHSGPDGPCEHCIVHLNMPGPRKGLLRVLGRESISLADLPPLPADLNSFAAINVDLAVLYDIAIKGAENAVRVFNPKREAAVRQGIKLVETVLGLSFRDDLFGALDNRVVRYSSPGDGPFSFGTVYLVKVKDTAKLQAALDKVTKGVARFPFVNVAVKKTTYHGATINEIRLGEESYRQLPSFAIHKDWLVYSSYPQPIRGFILRANGELPAWKIDADLTRRLAEFPKDYVGIAVSDPRPAVKTLLSLGPTAVGMINNLTARLGPQARFDLSLLPNAHEATRHLFPNITVITDDGRRVRIETRASLLLPF